MRNRKLCIMACCVAVGLSSAAQTQSPADSSDDQAKALEALRQAEHTAPAETPAKPAKKKPAKQQKISPAPVAQPPAAAPAASSDEQARALEALRQA
jgi:hypothetical protein